MVFALLFERETTSFVSKPTYHNYNTIGNNNASQSMFY
jgi:hypothetical protein